MASTIATLTEKNDGFEGVLKTLQVTAPIAIVPNQKKSADSKEPDYRIVAKRNGFELGAAWKRTSKTTGEEYISCSLSSPEFGSIYGNIAPSPKGKEDEWVIIWNQPGN